MAYKLKNKRKSRIAYQINIKGQIFQAGNKRELQKKIDRAEQQNKILWFSEM